MKNYVKSYLCMLMLSMSTLTHTKVSIWPILVGTISGVYAANAFDTVSTNLGTGFFTSMLGVLSIPAFILSVTNTKGLPIQTDYESRKSLATTEALTCALVYGGICYAENTPISTCIINSLLLWKVKDYINTSLCNV